jgi:hypothetical protein
LTSATIACRKSEFFTPWQWMMFCATQNQQIIY